MNYLLKSGSLYRAEGETCGPPLAGIRSRLCGFEKQITVGALLFFTDVRTDLPPEACAPGDCPKQYLLKNYAGEVLLSGIPRYAEGEDPSVVGWPIYRMPRINSVRLRFGDRAGLLQMVNSQNYRLTEPGGGEVLTVLHRGIAGGWSLEAARELEAELLCGIFIFCRYMERESEFTTV